MMHRTGGNRGKETPHKALERGNAEIRRTKRWAPQERDAEQRDGGEESDSQRWRTRPAKLVTCPYPTSVRGTEAPVACRPQDSAGRLGGTFWGRDTPASKFCKPLGLSWSPFIMGFLLAPQAHSATLRGFCSFVQ